MWTLRKEEMDQSRHQAPPLLLRRLLPALQPCKDSIASTGLHPTSTTDSTTYFHGEEYMKCVPKLLWLLNYLDKVRRRTALTRSPLEAAYALGSLDASGAASYANSELYVELRLYSRRRKPTRLTS